MNALRRWMDQADGREKLTLAELANTTIGTLYQIAGGYRTQGKARVSPDLAARLELGTRMLARKGLKPIKRIELSPVCAACEFARRCR